MRLSVGRTQTSYVGLHLKEEGEVINFVEVFIDVSANSAYLARLVKAVEKSRKVLILISWVSFTATALAKTMSEIRFRVEILVVNEVCDLSFNSHSSRILRFL